jgi:hypothetical protein
MRWSPVLAAALLTVFLAPLGAQNAASLQPGARVRVTTALFDREVARVVEDRGDSLALVLLDRHAKAARDTLVLALPDIAHLDVSRGRHSRAHGAAIGAGFGALLGVAIGLAAGEDCTGQEFICFDRGETATVGGLLGLPIGTIIGVLVPPGEKWEQVRPPVHLSIAPRGRGTLALSTTVSF